MKLTEEDKKRHQELYESLLNDPRILFMDGIPQHRGSTTYEHVLQVTKTAYRIAYKLGLNINYDALIRAGMLHDYFLYNWREDRSKLKRHGHVHPKIAANNAKRDFAISDLEVSIIRSHMWPINLFHFPYRKESFLISLSDKIVAIKEACTSKKYKDTHKTEYLHNIRHLDRSRKDKSK